MNKQVGSRVIAIRDAVNGVVNSFGAGVYAGDFIPSSNVGGFNFGCPNPRIDLDNGKVVWGCESWWGPEDAILKRFPAPEWTWVTVDIDEQRIKDKEQVPEQKE
jgi:hypothetical protein